MERRDRKRKVRDKPNKKWTDVEVRSILDYLQRAPQIESPTAQVFYKRFIELTGINGTWDLIRWKVRHLKNLHMKAKEWRRTTGNNLLLAGNNLSAVEAKMMQICPHYKQLDEIFGDKDDDRDYTDNGDLTTIEDFECKPTITHESMEEESSVLTDTFDSVFIREKPINNSSSLPPKQTAAHLAASQTERTEIFIMKMEWEREKYQNDCALSERRLKLEEDKMKAEVDNRKREFDFKVLELEKDERLQVLKLEMEERLQKFEIEMKYKYRAKE